MEGSLFRCNYSIAHGDADAVHEVVAMGLSEHLDAGCGRSRSKFRKFRLSTRMQVRLGIFDQAQCPGLRQQGKDNWQHV